MNSSSPRCLIRHHHHHHHHQPLHPQRRTNTMLLLLLASSLALIRSEGAFTTQQSSMFPDINNNNKHTTTTSFLGKTLFWGGSSSPQSRSKPQQQQQLQQQQKNDSRTKLTCVLQMPPRRTTAMTNNNLNVGDAHQHRQQLPSSSSSSTTSQPPSPTSASSASAATTVVVEYVAETKLPTDIGQFQLRAYRIAGAPVGQEPCVIYCRDKPPFGASLTEPAVGVPVRIHDQCLTSEVFRSQRCDCKEQLHMSLKYIQKHGGCIVYLQQEGRGIGLANKIAAYALQDGGLDTVDANLHLGFPEDCREYDIVPGILQDMRIASIQLMTNNPRKVELLRQHGVTVERTLPMVVPQTNPYNYKYLETKKNRMRHENLASLLLTTTTTTSSSSSTTTIDGSSTASTASQTQSLIMTPQRKPLADQYINNGTEMTANAVKVSLLVDDDEEEEEEEIALHDVDQVEGVTKDYDGWCFGKDSVEQAIRAVKRGEMVVVVDDMDRENEGDFIMAAEKCTDLDMAQIVRYSSGVVCIAMEDERMKELNIPPMVTDNQDPKGTAFGVSVDASRKHGITTGISASDRAKTAQILADPNSQVDDLVRPGHMFPLRAQKGGVLVRDGHTEASIDLARLAGLSPCGVLCEIVSEENPTEMMRLPELKRFCKRHGFVMTSIVDIAQFRREMEEEQ